MKDDEARLMRETIHAVFCSPNEADSNFEAANVVDGLFAIARALTSIAKAIDSAPIGQIDSSSPIEIVLKGKPT